MKRFSEYIQEMARKDIEGAEDEIEAKDWDKAARIYIFNAKKRGFDEKKIRMGLGSTFSKGGHAAEIKAGDITLKVKDAEDFKKAIQKELGKTAPTKAQKERQRKQKKWNTDSEDFKKAKKKKTTSDLDIKNKADEVKRKLLRKKVVEEILQNSNMLSKYLGEKDYCKNVDMAKDVEKYECKECDKKFKSKKSYKKHMKAHEE